MSRRVWGVIIVIVSLALIAGIVYIIFFYKFSAAPEQAAVKPPVQEIATNTSSSALDTAKITPSVQPVSPLKKAEVGADDLVRMASAFAERFGSYSNQSDYGNVRDLQIFMTPKMKDWADNYITDARARKTQTAIYYGIVTKAISGEAKKFDGDTGQAEILVKTQRRESAGVSGNSSTFYQDIIIKYSRERGVWLIDGLYWQVK